MASTTSSNSGVHSESASSRSQPPIKEEQDVSSENVLAEKLKKDSVEDQLEEMEIEREEQEMERQMEMQEKKKYKKYVAEYTRFLKAKYFSDKTIFGGNIYDVKMTSDGQTVKASRLPPYQSFADPAGFHATTSVSKPEEETAAETSNGKQTAKKSN